MAKGSGQGSVQPGSVSTAPPVEFAPAMSPRLKPDGMLQTVFNWSSGVMISSELQASK